MVKAFVDFDQENVQKKTAIRYYKNVPRYITRRFKRENVLKTVATQNTPEKIKKLNTIIKKIDNLKQKKIKKKEKVSLKRKRNVRDEVENENVETMFNKDLNYESSDEEQPAPVKYCSKKKIAVATKEKSIENIEAVGDDNIKLVKKTETFERQTNRSPKRRKKDFDSIFDSRYGMCIIS